MFHKCKSNIYNIKILESKRMKIYFSRTHLFDSRNYIVTSHLSSAPFIADYRRFRRHLVVIVLSKRIMAELTEKRTAIQTPSF